MSRYRIVPNVNDGHIWWSLQRKGWLFWRSLWNYCTEERAREALAKFQAAQGKGEAP